MNRRDRISSDLKRQGNDFVGVEGHSVICKLGDLETFLVSIMVALLPLPRYGCLLTDIVVCAVQCVLFAYL